MNSSVIQNLMKMKIGPAPVVPGTARVTADGGVLREKSPLLNLR
jgi:hypothetical protein